MVCVGLALGFIWVMVGLFTDAYRLAFLYASELHFSAFRLSSHSCNLRINAYFDLAIGAGQVHHLRALRSRFLPTPFRVALGRLPNLLSPR